MEKHMVKSKLRREIITRLRGAMLRWNRQGVVGIWLILSLSCWAQAQQANPAWFSQPQFLTYNGGLLISDRGTPVSPDQNSGLGQVPFTGEMFSVYLPNNQTDNDLQQEVNAWKSRGGIYFFASDIVGVNLIDNNSSPPPDWDPFRMRNIDGGYINIGGVYAANNTPLYSLSSPVFQSALKAAALRAVDLGADGLTFDDCPVQLYQILFNGPHGSGSFDAVTMAAFRTYLQQKYSAAVLSAQFGIADITSFDFGVYIHANSLTETWNQRSLKGLALEFFLFKRQESLSFLRDVTSSTKQYAQQQYGRPFLFNCNDGDDPIGYFITDAMDLAYAELPEIRGGDHPFAAVDVKAWKGWKSSITVKPTAMDSSWGPSAAPYLSKPTVNLERVLIADEAAAGGLVGATTLMNSGLGNPEPVDLSVVRRYASFILNNPQLMAQTTTHAQTLLLESAASLLSGILNTPAENNNSNGYKNYIGTGRLLLDSGITYDSIFLPDTSYSQLPPLALGSLTPYKVVIAPYSWALDDNQVSVLLTYAQQGGILIVDGHFANSQPDGTPASRPNVQAILAAPGAQPYGSGTIVVTSALYGVQYEAADMNGQRTIRAAFLSFLAPYASPDVVVTQPPAKIHEPGITPFFYRDRNGNALVHLVNYDYDDSTDQFHTKTNIQVQVQVGSQPVDAVILRSPDIVGTRSLPFTRSGSTITLTVPEVDAWDVLYFERSTLAPVINSASPAPTLGAVAGSSLSFSVQATDPDGNPLTYIWSVNGEVVTDVFGSSFTSPFPFTAPSGIYTIAVSVTDGSRVSETSWTINVAAYRKPRVLFDESHAEPFSIDATRAGQIDPGLPQYALYGILAGAMQPLYQVSRLTTGPITSQTLNVADVLMLAQPATPLSAAENQAIAGFVQAGGALIVASSGASMNPVLSPWGIQIDSTIIESPAGDPCCSDLFYASSYANHPALPPNPNYKTVRGGSLVISPPGVALVQTDATTWKSISGQATQQPGEPNGPFTLIGATVFGKGRVYVATSGHSFADENLLYVPSDTEIFLSALAWVSAGVNATPPPAPLSTPAPPAVAGLSPPVSTGNTQSLTLTYSAPAGYQTLGVLNVLINSVLDGRRACYVAFVPSGANSGALYLVDDAGDAGGPYSGAALPGTGSVQNSQCTVSGSASGSGNTLALVLNVGFSASFAGNKVVYAAARDLAQNNSGWQTVGVVGVPPLPSAFPNPVEMSPSSGNALTTTLTFTYQDQTSAANLQTVWALINTAIDGRAGCYMAYYRPGNQLYLYPDNGDGTQAANIVLTGNNIISNHQCSATAQGASVQSSGNTLTVTLPITFNTSFGGLKGVWLAGQTTGGAQTSPWQALGAWAVPFTGTIPTIN